MNIDHEKVIELVKSTDNIIFDEDLLSRVDEKGFANYVTAVDTSVQHYLEEELARLYPDIALMGEEEGEDVLHPEKACWILDPIDGTANLMHHYNLSAVSLGLWEKGQIIFGVVYNPFTKELFSAAKGQGAYMNGKRINTSGLEHISQCIFDFGTGPYRKDLADENFGKLTEIFKACQDIRRTGSAALDLCYTACGRCDGFFEISLKPWDYAAGSIILEEAGGVISDWKGDPVTYDKGCSVCAACSDAVQKEILNYLR